MPLNNRSLVVFVVFLLASFATAAPISRITKPIDINQRKVVSGTVHRLAQPQFDRGMVDEGMPMTYMILALRPSAAQQVEFETLLAEQQNPDSSNFHKWLTPESFADRFGLSQSDQFKVTQWLTSEGFTVNESGRGRNWIAFTGTAGQVSRALHTSIHRFQVNGETHYANTSDPSVPDAIAEVTSGFIGLHDFHLQSYAKQAKPNATSGTLHYLAPEDFSTIYDIAPLYSAGFDGTGATIAVVGESNIALSDLRSFKTRFNLPANDPKVVFYGGINPGTNTSVAEADLDLEWAGAIAPKAALYYYYGQDVFTATITAINANIAQIITFSYGGCELNFPAPFYRSIFQQASAQGITVLAASGDTGAAACDYAGFEPQVSQGGRVSFPAVLPEITAVGGTQFAEGTGTYFRPTNSANGGSAISYIPEEAWNESDDTAPVSGGGGASVIFPKPAWQQAPGVPNGNVRYVPDIALNASASIDPYYVYTQGGPALFGGTSVPTPSMAGVVALLNQYLVKNGTLKKPGLGNINPQLYRLSQAAPSALHDIVAGTNKVACIQGSVDCLTGFIGYAATPGYDLATGLGSLDVNSLFNSWNTTGKSVSVSLSVNSARVTLNDVVIATLTVTGTDAVPTGTVDFSIGGTALGSATLTPGSGNTSMATLSLPVGTFVAGTYVLVAQYSGNAIFNGGGATANIQITVPPNASAITLTAPVQVWPATPADPQGVLYQTTLTLRERAGVPAVVTGFTIDGVVQNVSQYFPTTAIPANTNLSITVTLKNLLAPATKTFGITGIDAAGVVWKRQATVTYFPVPLFDDFAITAYPSTISQDVRNKLCQWPVRLTIDDIGGFGSTLSAIFVGGVDYSDQITPIFGTPRLQELGSLQGTLCLNDVKVPGTTTIEVDRSDGYLRQIAVSFTGPASAASTLAVTPPTVSLASAPGQVSTAILAVNLADNLQSWTAIVTPGNRTTGWLTATQLAGSGSGQISLTASGAGFEPGVYRAIVTVQALGTSPQSVSVPVTFVYNGSAGTMITGLGNAFSQSQPTLAPGMLLSIVGSNLSNTTRAIASDPFPYGADGVSVQVNGLQAPILFVSPTQLNIQVPYGAGAGPGVIGVNNNGQVAGMAVQIAPSAPGIFIGATPSVNQDGVVTLYLTGAGEVSNLITTGTAPDLKTAAANLPKSILPLQATVGGYPVFVQFAGIGAGLVGITQVNLIVPESVPLGLQDAVITINGVPSNPARITVLPPKR